MRHVWSLLLGLIVAPLAWLAMSIGQVSTGKEFDTYSSKGVFVAGDFVRPLAMLMVAGLLLGIIACLRISPVGPLVVGVGYLATFAGLTVWPHRAYDLFAYTFRLSFLHGQGKGDLTTPLTTGTAPVIGALLIVAVVSAKRWQRWPRSVGAHSIAAQDSASPAGYPEPASYPAPTWSSSGDTGSEPAESTPATSTIEPVPAGSGGPLPVRPVPRPTNPPIEPEPAGTVVWTREPASDQTTDSLSAAGRARSPWDTPPGDADGSQTR